MCVYENYIKSLQKEKDKTINIYEQFIKYLKDQEKNLKLKDKYLKKNSDLEKHHILPLHAGGKKEGPVVICTSKNHTLAHYYRYLIYNEVGDKVAYTMRHGSIISTKDRSLLGVQKMERDKINFFNPNWQSLQGSKVKKVKKTKKQVESCKKTGFNNKKETLKIISTKKTVWKYLSKTKNKEKHIEIEPQENFQEIISILYSFSYDNNLNKKTNFDKSVFYKIVKGQRKSAYGWSLYFIYL